MVRKMAQETFEKFEGKTKKTTSNKPKSA